MRLSRFYLSLSFFPPLLCELLLGSPLPENSRSLTGSLDPNTVPDKMSGNMSEYVSEKMPENMYQINMSEYESDRMSEYMSECQVEVEIHVR